MPFTGPRELRLRRSLPVQGDCHDPILPQACLRNVRPRPSPQRSPLHGTHHSTQRSRRGARVGTQRPGRPRPALVERQRGHRAGAPQRAARAGGTGPRGPQRIGFSPRFGTAPGVLASVCRAQRHNLNQWCAEIATSSIRPMPHVFLRPRGLAAPTGSLRNLWCRFFVKEFCHVQPR